MKLLKVACVGEAMVELSMAADDKKSARVGFAGDALNTAIYLKRSAADLLDVSFVTRLGRDAFSTDMLDFVRDEAISVNGITFSDDRTVGLYSITTDAAGERSFAYWRSASAARQMFQTAHGISFDELEGFDVIYFSAITLAILPGDVRAALVQWLTDWRKRTGGRVVFDSNYRPALWGDPDAAKSLIAQVWQQCDIALPTIDDEMEVFADPDQDDVIERLKGWGVSEGALKCGSLGPVSFSDPNDGETYDPAKNVVDTTSAGDSFNGGYLAALLTGKGQIAALRAGHDLASKVVGHKGAIIPNNS